MVRQLCVPTTLYKKILNDMHDNHGHQSVDKTFANMLHRYYWPSMYVYVKQYINDCETCLKRKTPHHTTHLPMLSPQRDLYSKYGPREAIAIDYVGPLPLSTNRKVGMITVIDIYTRFAITGAITAPTTRNCVCILDRWFDTYGLPKIIISDNGSQFTSSNLKKLCAAIGIERKCVLPYSPWSNGINERFNGTIVNMVATYISQHNVQHKYWDTYINKCTFAYNTSIHPTTGFSPFRLMFGGEALIGSEGMLAGQRWEGKQPAAYVQDLVDSMEYAHTQVTNRVIQQAEKRDKGNREKALVSPFAVGDIVYMYRIPKSDKKKGIAKKLLSPWEGPYIIIESFNNVSFKIKHQQTGQVQKAHASRLKKLKVQSNIQHNNNIPILPSVHSGTHHDENIPILPSIHSDTHDDNNNDNDDQLDDDDDDDDDNDDEDDHSDNELEVMEEGEVSTEDLLILQQYYHNKNNNNILSVRMLTSIPSINREYHLH